MFLFFPGSFLQIELSFLMRLPVKPAILLAKEFACGVLLMHLNSTQ